MLNTMPNIPNTTVEVAFGTAWKITANVGYVFYCLSSYPEGTPPEEIAYSRFGYFPQSVGAEYLENDIVVVPESEVPENQIYGTTPETEKA